MRVNSGARSSEPVVQTRDWLIALAIFLIALIVRLLFLYSRGDASWPHAEGEQAVFDLMAQ
jgi:hypothetical protein